MNATLILGMGIVTGALTAYSVAVFTEQRKKCLTPWVMAFLTIGICLDVTATACMIIGSSNMPFTVHGVLGYSALAGMLIDTVLTWRHWMRADKDRLVSRGLLVYTRIAYLWWVVAFIAGGAIAALS